MRWKVGCIEQDKGSGLNEEKQILCFNVQQHTLLPCERCTTWYLYISPIDGNIKNYLRLPKMRSLLTPPSGMIVILTWV